MPPPPRSHGPDRCAGAWAGGSRAARALDVHDWVHVCVHMCVRSSACVRMHTYARMRRMHSSVRVGVCARTRAQRRQRERRDGDLHLGITVHMSIIICTRARMYTCVRALVACIPACVGVGVAAGVRGGSGRPLIVCHFVHFISMYIYI